MSFVQLASELAPDLVRFRHQLHQEPEIGLDLPRTQEKVLAALADLPLEISRGTDCSSVTAVLRGQAPGAEQRRAVLLRADMDALPVQERTGVEFTSRLDGAMHACGHDLHTAMLAGSARLLAERVHQLPGDVVFMFQPGEEGFDGASVMIREGVLEASGRRADAAYGMHVFSGLEPHAQFATKRGVMMSASDGLTVTVLGAGGHGSAPHKAKDPVTTVSEMITALQVMVTRQFNMFDPVVLSVGVLQAGTKRNIIPETASFEATIRTFSEANQQRMMTAIPRLLKGIAAAHDLDVDVVYNREYPVTVTNVEETMKAENAIDELFGPARHSRWTTPMSGSEDFSRVLNEIPGSFIGLGAAAPGTDHANAPFNHSAYATFDDSVLADGAALYSQLAASRLEQLSGPASTDAAPVNKESGR
ncbi:amidohydrolase [Paenarthrobacter sp. Z7-10]|uniref:M20 metallopeptidase family protein n=1 Tax=Paenarthrobacter sp. Z7-10 TaxID=2787635 RepID=UPI0022A96907|nr:M20 family metallopeptidase [Paenarthrobacter sp. Z7-10]MCZ2401848.1 amidohydrolase [Paenarthrobacter sp. Z7-10]